MFSTTLREAAGWRGAIGMVGVIVTGAVIAQTGIGRTILESAGIAAEPSGYTSLSFLRPPSLPDSLSPKRQNVDLSFIITNHADSSHNYQWSLRLSEQGSSRELASGQLSLAPAQMKTVNESDAIGCTTGRVKLTVALAHPAESIDVWAVCRTQKS